MEDDKKNPILAPGLPTQNIEPIPAPPQSLVITEEDFNQESPVNIEEPAPINRIDTSQFSEPEAPQETAPTSADDFISDLEEGITRREDRNRESDIRSEAAGAEKQVREKQKELSLLQIEAQEAEQRALQRGETLGFASGESRRVLANYAFKEMRVAAELQALQGNYDLALTLGERAVDQRYQDEDEDLRIRRNNIINNWDTFTEAEKKEAEETLARLDVEDAFLKERKALDRAIGEWKIKAAATGRASNAQLRQFDTFTTEADAAKYASQFINDTPLSTTNLDEVLTINQIDQFRRSYGWTPPFGYTFAQLQQYMADNPDATPEELEAGAQEAGSGEAGGEAETEAGAESGQDVAGTISYISQNLSANQLDVLHTKAQEAGVAKWWHGKKKNVEAYLESIRDKIFDALAVDGYTKEEILEFLTAE